MKEASVLGALEKIRILRNEDPPEAIRIAMKLIQSLKSINPNDERLPISYYLLACAHFYQGDYSATSKYCKQSITALDELAPNDDLELRADIQTLFASISNARGVYEVAVAMLEEAILLYKEAGCDDKTAYVLQRLANAQFDLRIFEPSKKTLLRCLEICAEKPEYSLLRTQVITTLGMTCRELQDYDEANLYLQQALEISLATNDKLGVANSMCELGQLYTVSRQHELALKYCQSAESEFRRLGNDAYVAASLLYQGKVYADRQSRYYNKTKAEQCYLESLQLAHKSKFQEWIMSSHESLSKFYEDGGDDTKALIHYKEFLRLQFKQQDEAAKMRIEQLQVTLEVENEREKRELERSKNASLMKANDSLQYLLNERKEFMGLAAHELKNPLSGILGIIDYLKEHECCESHVDVPPLIEMLEQSSINALDIVTSLLQDNRLEEGKVMLDFEEVNVCCICREVTKTYQARADAKKIKLACLHSEQEEWMAYADPFSIKQIIDNLVSNAIKFSTSGCQVSVAIEACEDPSYFCMKICDDGPGISKDDQSKLFGRFSKLSNKPTANESTSGLGLSIVKKLVELNGGSISCHSQVGKGTSFIVKLPHKEHSE